MSPAHTSYMEDIRHQTILLTGLEPPVRSTQQPTGWRSGWDLLGTAQCNLGITQLREMGKASDEWNLQRTKRDGGGCGPLQQSAPTHCWLPSSWHPQLHPLHTHSCQDPWSPSCPYFDKGSSTTLSVSRHKDGSGLRKLCTAHCRPQKNPPTGRKWRLSLTSYSSN